MSIESYYFLDKVFWVFVAFIHGAGIGWFTLDKLVVSWMKGEGYERYHDGKQYRIRKLNNPPKE